MTTVMEVINQAIGTWGFPIAMCLVLVWYVVRKDKQHREDMRALREEQAQIRKENKEINEKFIQSIDNNTKAMQALTERIDTSGYSV